VQLIAQHFGVPPLVGPTRRGSAAREQAGAALNGGKSCSRVKGDDVDQQATKTGINDKSLGTDASKLNLPLEESSTEPLAACEEE
ncbi:unnamed protein product, partial [Amoebophrya sp. A25]